MEEIEMDNFTEDEIDNYTGEQLTDYFNDLSEKRNNLYKQYGDSDNTPEEVRVRYTIYDAILNRIEES